jgi:hypothetical protein
MIADLLNQTVTTIYSVGRDGYGTITKTSVYSNVECRWEEKFQLVLNKEGNEVMAQIECWLPTNIEGSATSINTDYIFLFGGAEYTVLAYNNNYNIRGQREYVKAFLS